MSSASSRFLLSFCFRKVVLQSFSERAENLLELFPSRKEPGDRRSSGGGPPSLQAPPGCGLGVTRGWVPPSPLRCPLESTLRLFIRLRLENPKEADHIHQNTPRPPPSQTLVRKGSAALPGTLPEASTSPCLPPE